MIENKEQLQRFLDEHHNAQPEFHQAVLLWYENIEDTFQSNKEYVKQNVLERMIEADRLLRFRVTWEDDDGNKRVNRAWRVQHSNALGPYKGGLRFHPTVNPSILKFLAFEQASKNALTGLPMGGGKGGADINPKQMSDAELHRFCKAFMDKLYRHIGEHMDVPAGDIGVGGREVGYMFGQYVRLTGRFEGSITGKGPSFGGSCGREEATGYGCVYFLRHMLNEHDLKLKKSTVCVSGAGNVALFAAEKCLSLGAKVLTVSDSKGTLYFKDGIEQEQLETIKHLKFKERGRLSDYEGKHAEYRDGKEPWDIPCDIALPCATENEVDEKEAELLIKNGVKAISEGANMPLTEAATKKCLQNGVIIGPAKAANAGGVAVSGFERTQNALHLSWTLEKVDKKLQEVMERIHQRCIAHIEKEDGYYDYTKGADIAAFHKWSEAIIALG